MVNLSIIVATAISLTGSILIGRNADWVGGLFGLVDSPDEVGGLKQHPHPTPLVGGMAVCLAAIAGALVEILWSISASASGLGLVALAIFACGVTAMFAIGAADDRHTLSPRTRLAVSILVFLAIMASDPMFVLTKLRFGGDIVLPLGSMGIMFTLVCLVGLLNAVNMADGKNGLVISLGLIWCLVLATHASSLWYPVLGAMAASLAVMRWFNMRGKLFLGDGGSYSLSAAFGLMAIHIHLSNPVAFGAEQVALLFAIPVLDTIRLMLLRAARGKSPFVGDNDHLHHHLARSWGWQNGLYVYCALVGIPNLLAIMLPASSAYALLGTALGYGLVIAMSHAPEPELIAAPASNVTRIGGGRPSRGNGRLAGRIDEDAA